MLIVASCGGDAYDDTALRNELTNLANRVAQLEQLCQQMNTNISSLQTIVNALQQNDFVTAVVPVTQGGKVIGYTITFSRSGAITIYHGHDGVTPQISVKKDIDGIYYWTLNGEWLTDTNGNKIQAEGTDGQNGAIGANGITPQLKIEEDYWYISYDNGETWILLGKAVGEDGADGQDGDSIFLKVTQDDELVYFYLADGTMITIPKHDQENIQFEDLNVKMICCKNWDANNDGELSYAEAAAVTDIGTTFQGNATIIAFHELKYFTGLTAIANSAFESCENLWKLIIPDNVASIGSRSFWACYNIEKIAIPSKVTTIGSQAFAACSSMKTLGTLENIVMIGDEAFSSCSCLTSISLPNTLQIIGKRAFYGCRSLTKIIIPQSVTTIGEFAFANCSGLQYLYLPETKIEMGRAVFSGCTGELVVNCNVSNNSESFRGSFTKLTFGDSVTDIAYNTFNEQCDLVTIELGCGIKTISYEAFSCWKLRYPKLRNVYIKAIVPPSQPAYAFDFYKATSTTDSRTYYTSDDLKIFVPTEALEAYQTQWGYYKNHIVGYDF